jgi:hypothetical protein
MQRLPRPGWPAFLVLLTGAVAVALLMPAGLSFGLELGDLPGQFASWRAFAVDSVRAGHFPLWNPYTYSGEPFLGGFQSALLYPPNLVFLLLPLPRAIDLSVLAHLLVLGWGLWVWADRRGLHPLAGFLAGMTLVLSGVVYPHVYAGHLSNICTIAWAPWILGGLESWWRDRRRAGLFEASGAICLQILAGHSQYVFLTALAAGLFGLLSSIAEPSVRRRALPAVAACYLGAALLAAAQLFPGFAALGESVRQAQSFDQARVFSFPPENFVTLFAPGFFGDPLHSGYWGRWYIQEMTVFIGAAGLILILLGSTHPSQGRRARWDLAACGLLLLLALGAYTPLYRPLYDFVPGFRLIRGMSKFTFPALLFAALALGAGVDALIRREPIRRGITWFALGLALALALAGFLVGAHPEWIGDWMRGWQAAAQSYLPKAASAQSGFVSGAASRAAHSLLVAAGLFLLTGASLIGAARRPWLRWIPLGLLLIDLAGFAWTNSALCNPLILAPPELRTFFSRQPGDYRILSGLVPSGNDDGFLMGKADLWGNDAFVLHRYAEFMTFSRGLDPSAASQALPPFTSRDVSPLYALLRCRYFIGLASDGGIEVSQATVPPLERAQLVSSYRRLGGRDAIFAAMSTPGFDPRQTVLLESDPLPRPVVSGIPGTVHAVETSPDTLAIEAEVSAPTLLLVTDPYSRDWRAVPLPGSSQQSYRVLPADYVLRAIPLTAGHHHILMEYAPPSFPLGLTVSALAWAAWLAAAVRLRPRRREIAA